MSLVDIMGILFKFMLFAILSSEIYSTSWGILLGIKLL